MINKLFNTHRIHLPAQSGNSQVLNSMRRYYTREAYLELVQLIRDKIPKIALSSDFIAGFCGETNAQFSDTLTLIEKVEYDMAYLFAYSMREKTHAYNNLKDDVPEQVKKLRLTQMINQFRAVLKQRNLKELNSYHIVLVEGKARRSALNKRLVGRTDTNKLCIFSNEIIPANIPEFLSFSNKENLYKFFEKNHQSYNYKEESNLSILSDETKTQKFFAELYESYLALVKDTKAQSSEFTGFKTGKETLLASLFSGNNKNLTGESSFEEIKIGEYIIVKINDCSTNTLFGTPVCKLRNMKQFFQLSSGEPYFKLFNKIDDEKIFNLNNIFS